MPVYEILQFIHIVACFVLIFIVLLQASEGEGLSGAFGGGGSYALFGKRGATGFVAKATSTAAIVFMLTSFTLSYREVQARKAAGSDLEDSLPTAPLATDGPATGAPLANQE